MASKHPKSQQKNHSLNGRCCHRGLEANAPAKGVASMEAGTSVVAATSGACVSTVAGVSAVLGASVEVAAAAGTWDVGREPCTPEAGLDPKALLNLALALFIVRSPTIQPPWSTFSFVAWCSSRSLLSASMRSSAVAWRIRPTLRVLRMRERRLRRAVSVGTLERLPGPSGIA